MRHALTGLMMAACLTAPAFAKLPAPTLDDAAKAKAAEAAAKAAWANNVGAFQLCRSMNRVAERYRSAHKDAPAAVETPACGDPGPFVAPPLEAAGAHSPATTATAPPSSKATAAEIKGGVKK